ncbi:MAG: c-type cytochrome [Steroidobacteraceae bacterium]
MLGLNGVLIALIVLTILLAGVFLVRSSFAMGTTGKILAFLGLFVLPVLCIDTGVSVHTQRSQQTSYCVSCHSMASHGKSLYVLDPSYIPAQHFQNHLVPPDKACYTCHADYAMYGSLKDKLKGLRYVYFEYVGTLPKTIRLDGTYSNMNCLRCHAGARKFDENPAHAAIKGSLNTNRISCISCHNTIHNASEVDHLKLWVDGDAPTSAAAGTAQAATSGSSNAPAKSDAGAAATGGKAIFDSNGCAKCHGAAGAGGSGPALTQVSSQYPPKKLAALLKALTPKLKAAGMVPLTLNDADMKALVSYLSSLGGGSASAAPTVSGSSPSAPAKAKPSAAGGSSKAKAKSAAGAAPTGGKAIFDSNGCAKCHGAAGAGGSGPALTQVSSQYPSEKLAALLKAPTPQLKAAGMVPLTLNDADMKALVSYVSSLGGGSASAAPATSEPSSGAPAEPVAAAGSSNAPAKSDAGAAATGGKAIFDSNGCAKCHGTAGAGGSAPALTRVSSQYPPEKLTALLKAPTPKLKAAGMVPLTLNDAEMKALVSYVSGLGGASDATSSQKGYTENKDDVALRTKTYPAAIRKSYRAFEVKCNQCHGLDESLKAGASTEQAVAEVNRMQAMASSQISDDQAKTIVNFLNYNREHREP